MDLDESSELAFTASGDKVRGKASCPSVGRPVTVLVSSWQTVGVWQLSSGLCLKRLKHTNGLPVVALQWQEVSTLLFVCVCGGGGGD